MDLLLSSRELICTSFFVQCSLIKELLFSARSTIYHLQSVFKFGEKRFSFIFRSHFLFICSIGYLQIPLEMSDDFVNMFWRFVFPSNICHLLLSSDPLLRQLFLPLLFPKFRNPFLSSLQFAKLFFLDFPIEFLFKLLILLFYFLLCLLLSLLIDIGDRIISSCLQFSFIFVQKVVQLLFQSHLLDPQIFLDYQKPIIFGKLFQNHKILVDLSNILLFSTFKVHKKVSWIFECHLWITHRKCQILYIIILSWLYLLLFFFLDLFLFLPIPPFFMFFR